MNRIMGIDDATTSKIIGCAMQVHRTLGPGFLESVYENALAHELRKAGLQIAYQHSLAVHYDGINVGNFVVDMMVEDRVIVENKAVMMLTKAHEVQLVNYLSATGIDVGRLINFGAQRLEFKRKYRTYKDTKNDGLG
jgi:GxxExxY protein